MLMEQNRKLGMNYKYALRTKSIQVKLLMFVFTDSAGEAPVANARDLMLKKFIPSSHK